MSRTIEEIMRAEALRGALQSAKQAEQDFIEALKDKASLPVGSKERRQVLKERARADATIQELKEALKDAPPSPISLNEAKKELAEIPQGIKAQYEKRVALFMAAVERSPKHAITWGEETVAVQTRWEVFKPVLAEIEREDSTLDSIKGVLDKRKVWVADWFFSNASNIANSSSALHNAVKIKETETLAKIVEGRYVNSFERRLADMLDGVAVWELLNEEGE